MGPLLAQPRLERLPPRPNERTPERQDSILLYGGPQEAALAAFHQAYEAAGNRNRDRAIRLMLLALKRNPRLDKALYDLGILCAQGGRWDDALKLQHEVLNRAPGSGTAKLASQELERLAVVAALERTGEGFKQRDYDKQLLRALSNKDEIKLLEAANGLIKTDGTRWEGFALAGIENAATKDYPKAQEVLTTAVSLAPGARRRGIQNAADIAHSEASFIRQVKDADGYWFNHQYEQAAKAYADAWETSPDRSDVGMRAATGFLMADKVDLAVTVLSRMRAAAQPELSAKITAMLRELGAISEEAKSEVAHDVASEGVLPEDPAVRIRREIGTLTTEEIVTAAKPDPQLLSDTTTVVGERSLVVQDGEINGREAFYDSKTSIFGLYQSNLAPATSPPPAQEAPPSPARPAPAEGPPQPAATAAPKGVEQVVEVLIRPAQASVTLDKDERPIACVAPCKVSLASGRHTLLARLAGYRDAHRIFEVSRNMKPLELELEARRGTLNIESIPSQLPVFVNGSRTGQNTPVLMTLNEGSYKIGVESDGQLIIRDVQVTDEAILTIRFPE
jgi:tetratricopeptide (TPR) repeat protein